MNCSMPGFPVLLYLPEFAQIHCHWVSDAIQPSHPLSPPSSLALNLSQHQGLSQWHGDTQMNWMWFLPAMNMASYRHVMSYFFTSILAQNSNVLDTKENLKSLKKVKPLLFGLPHFFSSILAQNSNVLDTKENIKSLKKVKPLLLGLPPVLETPPPQFFLLLLQIQIPIWASSSFYPFFSDDPTYSHFFNHHLHLDFFPLSSRPYVSNGQWRFLFSVLKTLLLAISVKVIVNHSVLQARNLGFISGFSFSFQLVTEPIKDAC